MKFGDDWTGVFIRGDNAFGVFRDLRDVIEKSSAGPLQKASVRSLMNLLATSDESVGVGNVQHMKSFAECKRGCSSSERGLDYTSGAEARTVKDPDDAYDPLQGGGFV
jgi:hypothetical protein